MTLDQMGINEWLIIGGALIGPVLAVQAQKWVERVRSESTRRAWIFETLMSTRGARMAPDHVRALNAIDLAFYGTRIFGTARRPREYQVVIDAWRDYHAHLSVPDPQRMRSDAENAAWGGTGQELFVNLLAALATANHYKFDRAQLQSGGYTPQGYSNVDQEQQFVRIGLIQALSGTRPLAVEIRRPLKVTAPGASQETANTLHGLGAPKL